MPINRNDKAVVPMNPRSVVPGEGSFEVRELTNRDLGGIAAYYLGLDEMGRVRRFNSPLDTAAILSYVNNADLSRITMVGAVDWATAMLIGVAEMHPGRDDATAEATVTVTPGARGILVGVQLVAQIMDTAATRGFERIEFDIHPEDRDTFAVLRHFGADFDRLNGTAVLSWAMEDRFAA